MHRRIGQRVAALTARALAAGLLCLVGACRESAPPETRAGSPPLTLFAAASTADALEEVAAAFEEETGAEARINAAGSATLARQIEAGAPADLFLSANREWMDYLVARGLVDKPRDLLGNRLVVIQPAGAAPLDSPEDFLAPAVRRIAVGDPESVPAGAYARQALKGLGLWDRLGPRLVPGSDVRQTLWFVERGEADAGIVYATDAAASDAVRVAFELDPALTGPIRYPVARVKRPEASPRAQEFLEYLTGPAAAAIFERHGFLGVGR